MKWDNFIYKATMNQLFPLKISLFWIVSKWNLLFHSVSFAIKSVHLCQCDCILYLKLILVFQYMCWSVQHGQVFYAWLYLEHHVILVQSLNQSWVLFQLWANVLAPPHNFPILPVIIKITISSLVIGLKKSYFPLIHLPSCYQTVCYRTVQETNQIQSCRLNQPITYKVVV